VRRGRIKCRDIALGRGALPRVTSGMSPVEVVMLPVQKHSKARKRKRRAHLALRPIHYVRCAQCGSAKLPHAACDNCGYVNPKLALQVEQEQD
jgi:large subunit ribosomal protein L32